MNSFPSAVVTRYHTLGGLQPQKVITVLEARSRNKGVNRLFEVSTESFLAALSACGFRFLVLGIPWLVDASVQSLPPSPHGVYLSVSVFSP